MSVSAWSRSLGPRRLPGWVVTLPFRQDLNWRRICSVPVPDPSGRSLHVERDVQQSAYAAFERRTGASSERYGASCRLWQVH